MTFERILSHFQVRKRGTGKAQCICPAHADREASLTLTDGNDRALITYKSTAEKYNVESQKLEHINGRLYSSYNKLKNKVEEYRQKNSRLVQVIQSKEMLVNGLIGCSWEYDQIKDFLTKNNIPSLAG